MQYCPYCGVEMDDRAAICVKCGRALPARIPQATVEEDFPNKVLVICLSFFIPLFGFLYVAIHAQDHPGCARGCTAAAILSVIVVVAILLLPA